MNALVPNGGPEDGFSIVRAAFKLAQAVKTFVFSRRLAMRIGSVKTEALAKELLLRGEESSRK